MSAEITFWSITNNQVLKAYRIKIVKECLCLHSIIRDLLLPLLMSSLSLSNASPTNHFFIDQNTLNRSSKTSAPGLTPLEDRILTCFLWFIFCSGEVCIDFWYDLWYFFNFFTRLLFVEYYSLLSWIFIQGFREFASLTSYFCVPKGP